MKFKLKKPILWLILIFPNSLSTLDKVKQLAAPHVEQMGFQVVRILLEGGSEKKCLQIMIDRQDNQPLSADDCARVSRSLSLLFDVEDVIKSRYDLEISSPGLERPLVTKEDFKRFCGQEVMVKSRQIFFDRKSFIGLLSDASEENITLHLSDHLRDGSTTVTMAYEDIKSANLYVDYDKLLRK